MKINGSSHYSIATIWFLTMVALEVVCNLITKILSSNIPSYETVFLSSLFSTVMLLPLMIYRKNFKTKHHLMHISRGLLLYVGMIMRYSCLLYVPITTVTLIGFISPIFFLIFAFFFLKEPVGLKKCLISLISFLGVIIALNPVNINFHPLTWLLLLSGALLSILDIINKKYIPYENNLNILFYLFFYSTLFSLLPLLYIGWVNISIDQIILCVLLGMGGNLVILLLIKAFSLTDASALSHLRYTALPISIILSYLAFNELPDTSVYIGTAIIISCNATAYIEEKYFPAKPS